MSDEYATDIQRIISVVLSDLLLTQFNPNLKTIIEVEILEYNSDILKLHMCTSKKGNKKQIFIIY